MNQRTIERMLTDAGARLRAHAGAPTHATRTKAC